jgi:phosphocarrier protein HPr
MAVMVLGVKCGQTVTVEVTGNDEETACNGIKAFFEENL